MSQTVSSEYPEPFLDCDICDTWESLEVGVRSAVVSILVMARNLFFEAPVVCTESDPSPSQRVRPFTQLTFDKLT